MLDQFVAWTQTGSFEPDRKCLTKVKTGCPLKDNQGHQKTDEIKNQKPRPLSDVVAKNA